jgi:predicted transcriptional regulator
MLRENQDVLNVVVQVYVRTNNSKADVLIAEGVVYVSIRNGKTIALSVLKVNVFVNIKNEKADAQNVMVRKYVVTAIINTPVSNVMEKIFASTKKLKINASNAMEVAYVNIKSVKAYALNAMGPIFVNTRNNEINVLSALQTVGARIVN